MSTSMSAISESVGRCMRHSPYDTSSASGRTHGHDAPALQFIQSMRACSTVLRTSSRNSACSGARQTRIRETSHWLTHASMPSSSASSRRPFLQKNSIGSRQSLFPNPNPCSPSGPWSGASSKKNSSSSIRCYTDSPKNGPVKRFFKNVQSSLPIVGLLSRLFSDEGGVGSDHLRLPEFRRKVEKLSTSEAAMAYTALEQRYGKMARKDIVMIWLWAAAVGAGLVKSDELLLCARRMRASQDVEYELDLLDVLMEQAIQKRAKSKAATSGDVPMEARAQKCLEAICACCIGSKKLLQEDAKYLETILANVFDTVDTTAIHDMVNDMIVSPSKLEVDNVDKQDVGVAR